MLISAFKSGFAGFAWCVMFDLSRLVQLASLELNSS